MTRRAGHLPAPLSTPAHMVLVLALVAGLLGMHLWTGPATTAAAAPQSITASAVISAPQLNLRGTTTATIEDSGMPAAQGHQTCPADTPQGEECLTAPTAQKMTWAYTPTDLPRPQCHTSEAPVSILATINRQLRPSLIELSISRT